MAGKISSIKRPIEVRRTAALDVADFEALSLRAYRAITGPQTQAARQDTDIIIDNIGTSLQNGGQFSTQPAILTSCPDRHHHSITMANEEQSTQQDEQESHKVSYAELRIRSECFVYLRNVVREGQLIVHRGRTILLPVDFRGPDPRPSVTVVPVINPIKKGPALSGLLVPAMTDNICRGVALKVRPLIPQMAGIGDGHCGQFAAGPFTTTESDKMAALETALVVSGFRGH
ncbi:hypothetical protein Bbelb_390910 [Branchiostoma belcheri]|nr:hypothetical protein Bbelb_390910 [Branchiostoma belcheri]